MASRKKFQRLHTARTVVRALGGVDGVERLTGALRTSIFNWMMFRRFPAHYYVVMHNALRARGFTAPHILWRQVGNHHAVAITVHEQRAA